MNEYRPSSGARIARWSLRGLMIAVILFLALQQGFGGKELLGVVLAIVWALALPVLLTWSWRQTRGRPSWQRVAFTGFVGMLLLVGFAVGVRPLVG